MIFRRHYFQLSRMVTDYRVHIRTLFPVWEITQNVCVSNVGPNYTAAPGVEPRFVTDNCPSPTRTVTV